MKKCYGVAPGVALIGIGLCYLMILLIFFCSCGTDTEAQEKYTIESDVLVEETTNPNAYMDEAVLDMLNETWEENGMEGEWTFFETEDGLWCYVFIPAGTENDGITPFIEYYNEYGADDDFIYYWYEGTVPLFQELSGVIEDRTGEVVLIGIANPYNPDNVILVVNRDTIVYDAFYD